MKQGATIIDVRTKGEFASGHISGSVNIPLQNLQNNLSKINKDKPVITCCASGMRSASAKNILKANGFTEVHNGGGWMSLKNKIR
jgi:rhodanese-related sulfurtransferase